MKFTFCEYNYSNRCTLEWHGTIQDFSEIFDKFLLFLGTLSDNTVRVTMNLETITEEVSLEADRDIH